ncbi:MAG: hypothetical protein BPH100C_215 [Phage 5P_2]|nr:MAG: hypothetical protein BPH100C_215 [Phage 5P_2]
MLANGHETDQPADMPLTGVNYLVGEKEEYSTGEVAKLVGLRSTWWLRKKIKYGEVSARKVPSRYGGGLAFEYRIPASEVKRVLVERLVRTLSRKTSPGRKAERLQPRAFDPKNTPPCPECGKPSGYPQGGLCIKCYRKRQREAGKR